LTARGSLSSEGDTPVLLLFWALAIAVVIKLFATSRTLDVAPKIFGSGLVVCALMLFTDLTAKSPKRGKRRA